MKVHSHFLHEVFLWSVNERESTPQACHRWGACTAEDLDSRATRRAWAAQAKVHMLTWIMSIVNDTDIKFFNLNIDLSQRWVSSKIVQFINFLYTVKCKVVCATRTVQAFFARRRTCVQFRLNDLLFRLSIDGIKHARGNLALRQRYTRQSAPEQWHVRYQIRPNCWKIFLHSWNDPRKRPSSSVCRTVKRFVQKAKEKRESRFGLWILGNLNHYVDLREQSRCGWQLVGPTLG